MAGGGDSRRGTGGLDLVTVVFRDELPLLGLQARSIARFFEPGAVARIFVIVNDVAEDECARAVEALRPLYGRLADRVEVVRPAQLLNAPDLAPVARVERWYVAHLRGRVRRLLPRSERLANGWRGNSGWSMQQAFKLLAVNLGAAPHLLLLDAKNHFAAPVDAGLFVAADGRARTRRVDVSALQRKWVAASFRVLGLGDVPSSAPPTVTPVAMERTVMGGAVRDLERRLGPLEVFFARRKRRASEFMLLFAIVDRGEGAWWRALADGLPEATTLFAKRGDADVREMLDEVERTRPAIIGLHRRVLGRMRGETWARLSAYWVRLGLFNDEAEVRGAFPQSAGGAG